MKINTVLTAPILDMYDMDWEFDGKKGVSHFVVVYDYDNHCSERFKVDGNNSVLIGKLNNLSLLTEYKLQVSINEAYGKIVKELQGVESLGK